MTAGTLIGHTGNVGGDLLDVYGLDFGLQDLRDPRTDAGLVNADKLCPGPSVISRSHCHAVCPLDYMPTSLASQLQPLFVEWLTGDQYEPGGVYSQCGMGVYHNIAQTAQGMWFPQSAPGGGISPEDHYLFLGPQPFNPTTEAVLALGQSFEPPGTVNCSNIALPYGVCAGSYEFAPTASGWVNRAFDDIQVGVTGSSDVFCYENLPYGAGRVVLLQVVNGGSSLQVEVKSASNCAAASWSFTGGAVMFDR